MVDYKTGQYRPVSPVVLADSHYCLLLLFFWQYLVLELVEWLKRLLIVNKEPNRLKHICLFFMLLLLSQDLPSQSLVLRAGVVVGQEPQGLRHGYYCLLHHPHLHILAHS